MVGPLKHEELQDGAGAPKERGDGKGNLSQGVFPEQTAGTDEVVNAL